MDAILCLNVGSSSLTFSAYRAGSTDLAPAFSGGFDQMTDQAGIEVRPAGDGAAWRLDLSDPDDFPAAAVALAREARDRLGDVVTVAHRIVHGGDRFLRPARLTPETMAALEALAPLAPIHQPANLAPARAVAAALPDLLQVGVFDTAFHASLPDVARRLPLPDVEATRGLRRWGFHGLSYASVAQRMAKAAPERRRVVALHLSGGSSACALLDGRSLDTTMGATPLDGLMGSTRSGAVDPGALLMMLQERRMAPGDLSHMLWRESGLKGVSGTKGDLRQLLPARDKGDERAGLAMALFCRTASKAAAGMAVSLGGIDALVFTGGAGAGQPEVRARVCADLAWAGVRIHEEANAAGADVVSAADSPVEVRVMAAEEERVMAEDVLAWMKAGAEGDAS